MYPTCPKDMTLRTILGTGIVGVKNNHKNIHCRGMIVVNNCIIIQSYVAVNKENQQCVEAVFSHGVSKLFTKRSDELLHSKLPLSQGRRLLSLSLSV